MLKVGIDDCEASAKQIANKAASGDIKSIKLLMHILDGIQEPEPVGPEGHPDHILSAREILTKKTEDILEERGMTVLIQRISFRVVIDMERQWLRLKASLDLVLERLRQASPHAV